MSHEGPKSLGNWLRFVSILAAGALLFLGLVLLGGLTGLLWHIQTYDWWIRLNPTILGPGWDWVLWSFSFLASILLIIMRLKNRVRKDPVPVLTCLGFPALSLIALAVSFYAGATLLVASGFFVVYTLISRSELIVGMGRGLVLRLVLAEFFGTLAIIAAGSVVSLLVWNDAFVFALTSGSSLDPIDASLRMLAFDLEAFYIFRPLLTWVFFLLALAAVAALLGVRVDIWRLFRGNVKNSNGRQPIGDAESRGSKGTNFTGWIPYLILIPTIALGVAITSYPYLVAGVQRNLGSDSAYYVANLTRMNNLFDAFFARDRIFFFMLLFLIKVSTGLSPAWVVKLMPAILSALLACSSFLLVKEGTGRSWTAALAAMLSVVSAQTSLGMSAGIITNWFALCLANFMFALMIRSVKSHSRVAVAGSIMFSIMLLGSYALLWVIVIVILALILAASCTTVVIRRREQLKYQIYVVGLVLVGSILVPLGFALIAPAVGIRLEGLDVQYWLNFGWSYMSQKLPTETIGTAFTALDVALDFAGTRIDVPLLTILSIAALLTMRGPPETDLFRKILAGMVLLPLGAALITTDLYLTWRGLYVIPIYLMGALGAESIIHRVGGWNSFWKNPSRLAFAGAFVSYLFLSQLSYSLRALDLLILVGSR